MASAAIWAARARAHAGQVVGTAGAGARARRRARRPRTPTPRDADDRPVGAFIGPNPSKSDALMRAAPRRTGLKAAARHNNNAGLRPSYNVRRDGHGYIYATTAYTLQARLR